MSRPLVPLNLPIPGALGLNKQTSDQVLPPGWATKAVNLIFNENGRLASRKGTRARGTDSAAALDFNAEPFQYIDASDGKAIIYTDSAAIFRETGTSPNITSTDISGSVPTVEWKFVNFNGTCIGHEVNTAPIIATTISGNFATASGTQFNGSDVLSAFGRLWIIDGNDLRHSDVLINDFATGSAGSFDLAIYWPDGMDTAIALAQWNDHLVVFGRKSILVYENPDDPISSMQLKDIISGTGCIARDSVQSIGNDIVFLSNAGVKTLGRVIQEQSMPLRDISKNVRDYINGLVTTTESIKSVYSEDERFYLLSFKEAGVVMCFDMAGRLEDGSFRSTEWSMHVSGMTRLVDKSVILMTYDNSVTAYDKTALNVFSARDYDNYIDFAAQDGSGGCLYELNYEGAWNDFGEGLEHRKKIFKSMIALIDAPAGEQHTIKWATDYEDVFSTLVITSTDEPQDRAGIKLPMDRDGQVLKIGVDSDVFGNEKTLQRFNVMAKLGRYV